MATYEIDAIINEIKENMTEEDVLDIFKNRKRMDCGLMAGIILELVKRIKRFSSFTETIDDTDLRKKIEEMQSAYEEIKRYITNKEEAFQIDEKWKLKRCEEPVINKELREILSKK